MKEHSGPEEVTRKIAIPTPHKKEGAAYDKHELRERVAERKAILTCELERLQKMALAPMATLQIDNIAASLAALKILLPEEGDVISEVSAAEVNRWLVDAPFVVDEQERQARHEASR